MHIYCKTIDNLPAELTTLILGCNFNQELKMLPNTLVHLILGLEFNKSLDFLPPSIQILDLEYNDKKLSDVDYKNYYVRNSNSSSNSNSNSNSNSSSNSSFNSSSNSNSSNKIKLSKFNQPINSLPPNITKLILSNNFNSPINNLPDKLTKLSLEFSHSFSHPLDSLPESLTELKLGKNFSQPIDKLPRNITVLELGEYFSQPICNLPPKITKLVLGSKFNNKICDLPENLTTLIIASKIYNEPKLFLPPGLKFLHFVEESLFTGQIELPETLEELTLGKYFQHTIDIPDSLIKIKCSDKCELLNKTNNINNINNINNKCNIQFYENKLSNKPAETQDSCKKKKSQNNAKNSYDFFDDIVKPNKNIKKKSTKFSQNNVETKPKRKIIIGLFGDYHIVASKNK